MELQVIVVGANIQTIGSPVCSQVSKLPRNFFVEQVNFSLPGR